MGKRLVMKWMPLIMIITGGAGWTDAAAVPASAEEPPPPGTWVWGSYIGGYNYDLLNDMTLDSAGNIYLVGTSYSSGWTSGGYQTNFSGARCDGFVVKLNSAGEPLWSTYVGGNEDDDAYAVAVDRAGNCYVAGRTYSTGWVWGGYNSVFGGYRDGYVVKLDANGQHLWSTYVGGDLDDSCTAITVDGTGNAYVTGSTNSSSSTLATAGAYDTVGNGFDGFLIKFSPTGQRVWGTYLGGEGGAPGQAIIMDHGGNLCLCYGDALMKMTTAGKFLWLTHLGQGGYRLAVDSTDHVYIIGSTYAQGSAIGGQDIILGGTSDAFLMRLTPGGQFEWSTYIGEDINDGGGDVTTDAAGNALVTGFSDSAGWNPPGKNKPIDRRDAMVAKVSPTGFLLWCVFLGGSGNESGSAIAYNNAAGAIYVAGNTEAYVGPLKGWMPSGPDITPNGPQNGFVVQIRDGELTTPMGDLRSKITPAQAINDRARWRPMGTSAWLKSDETLDQLAPGTYTIEFIDLPNWRKPDNINVTVQNHAITAATGTYHAMLDLAVRSPQTVAARPGDSVALVATVSGLAPITIQWKKNGVAIPGATGTTLYFDSCRVNEEGFYTCEASNLGGTISTPPFHLIVHGGGSVVAYLLGLSADPTGLDLNGDKKVNVADALLGLRQTGPGVPSGPTPADGARRVSRRPRLDWDDALRARSYDLYLWPLGTTQPAKPEAAGLSVSQWDAQTTLSYSTKYQWQVKANGVNNGFSATGPVWTFMTQTPVTLVAPMGGEVWTRGATAKVSWKTVPALAGTTVRIELWRGTTRMYVIKPASSDPSGAKTETFTVPNISGVPPASDYRVRVISTKLEASGAGEGAWDESDNTLQIK